MARRGSVRTRINESLTNSGRPDPYPVVVEGASAIGGRLIGPGQCVDTIPVLVSLVGPDRLGDQHATALAVMGLGVERDGSPGTAHLDLLAIGEAQRRHVVGMDEDGRPSLALPRGRRLVEGGIEEGAGRAGGKTEGIFLYSELKMESGHYINLHHARFSYEYKFVNDYLWVLLAKHLKTKGVEYINFERDANIEGLRKHKQLLKPKRITSMHLAGQLL